MQLPVFTLPPADRVKASRNLLRSKSMLIRANVICNVFALSWHAFVYFLRLVWSGVVYLVLLLWSVIILITPVHYGDANDANNKNFVGRSRGDYMTFFAAYGAASVAGTQIIASFVSNEEDFKTNHKRVIVAVGCIVAVISFLTFYLILLYFTALHDPTPCKPIKIVINVFACFGVLAPGVSFIHWAVPVGDIAEPDTKFSPHASQKFQMNPKTRTYLVFMICYTILLYLCATVVRLLGKIFKTA